MARHINSMQGVASLDQVLDLALDLRWLWLEESALSEDLVQERVVFQPVPGAENALGAKKTQETEKGVLDFMIRTIAASMTCLRSTGASAHTELSSSGTSTNPHPGIYLIFIREVPSLGQCRRLRFLLAVPLPNMLKATTSATCVKCITRPKCNGHWFRRQPSSSQLA